jgi:NAD(P)-dependent dehydrogenase (short-subunit alcohol dehydrogenase family)
VSRWRSLGVADQYGKRAIVTGANTGLGFQSALALAGAGAEVVLAVRDLDKGQIAAQRIREQIDGAKVRVVYLDLDSLASIRVFAAGQAAFGPLDLLVNNAGLMLVPERELTADGFERHMGVNHLGHFALTAGLLPLLSRSRSSRVVSVTSIALAGRRVGKLDHGLGLTGTYNPMRAYGQSKLAVGLFAEELDRRLRQAGSPVVSVLAHPGWSATAVERQQDSAGASVRLARKATAVLGTSPRAGARPQVYASTAPDLAGGELIGPRLLVRGRPKPMSIPKTLADRDSAEWLWAESARLTGVEPRPVAGVNGN